VEKSSRLDRRGICIIATRRQPWGNRNHLSRSYRRETVVGTSFRIIGPQVAIHRGRHSPRSTL